MSQTNRNTETKEFRVPPQFAGERLDKALTGLLTECSRSMIQNLIRDGAVTLNQSVCLSPKKTLSGGEILSVELRERPAEPVTAEPEKIDLEVLYEDTSILVISKAPGMVVHPAAGNWHGTVVNALLGREQELAQEFSETDPLRPGIVHRLDKDTSGCLVIAKTPAALAKLSGAFAERKTAKTYLAILCGHLPEKQGKIVTLIGRHKVDRKKMAVVKESGKEAHTEYEIIREGTIHDVRASLAQIRIFTGRTHQIRVHMSYLGHPVAGDTVYGGAKRLPAPRQMLHAWKLSFPHPVSGKILSFEAPLPPDFQGMLDELIQCPLGA